MNFNEVLVDSSKQLISLVANQISNDRKLFSEVLNFSLEEKKQVSNRASRVVCECCRNYPELFFENIDLIIHNIPKIRDNSIARNLLQTICINIKNVDTEIHLGKIASYCFDCINNSKNQISLRYYSLKIINELTKKYPELIPEFIDTLEAFSINESVGIKGYSRKLLNTLSKQR